MKSLKALRGAQPVSNNGGLLEPLFQPIKTTSGDDFLFEVKIEGRLLKIGLGFITPELAGHWLKDNHCIRRQSERWIESIKAMIEEGRFPFTGETVLLGLDEQGQERLLDGQHRLEGILRSGKSLLCLIVFGLPLDTVNHVNVGRPRVPRDMVKGALYEHAEILAPAAKVVWLLERRLVSPSRDLVNDDIFDVLRRHDLLCHWADETTFASKGLRLSCVAACCYWISSTGNPLARDFTSRLLSGLDLRGPDDHASVLHKRIKDDYPKELGGASGRARLILNFFNVWKRLCNNQTPGPAKIKDKETQRLVRVDPSMVFWPGGAPYLDSPIVKGLN